MELVEFFEKMPQAQPIFELFAQKVLSEFSDVHMTIHKTQISFANRHVFACVWLPVRKMKNRPGIYLVISFGLDHLVADPRIVEAAEPYPQRWMHHVIVQDCREIDAQLMGWIRQAYQFARVK